MRTQMFDSYAAMMRAPAFGAFRRAAAFTLYD